MSVKLYKTLHNAIGCQQEYTKAWGVITLHAILHHCPNFVVNTKADGFMDVHSPQLGM